MASSTYMDASWQALPNEMMLAVIDILDHEDIENLSKVDQRTYQACVPARFKVRPLGCAWLKHAPDKYILF